MNYYQVKKGMVVAVDEDMLKKLNSNESVFKYLNTNITTKYGIVTNIHKEGSNQFPIEIFMDYKTIRVNAESITQVPIKYLFSESNSLSLNKAYISYLLDYMKYDKRKYNLINESKYLIQRSTKKVLSNYDDDEKLICSLLNSNSDVIDILSSNDYDIITAKPYPILSKSKCPTEEDVEWIIQKSELPDDSYFLICGDDYDLLIDKKQVINKLQLNMYERLHNQDDEYIKRTILVLKE